MADQDVEMLATQSPSKKMREGRSGRAEEVYCWGAHSAGQLGVGKMEDTHITKPTLLNKFQGRQVQAFSCGVHHTLVVLQDGTVYSCGKNDSAELGHTKDGGATFEQIEMLETRVIRAASCGLNFSVVVTDTGQLLTWGDNTYGQLGKGFTDSNVVRAPKLVKNLETQRVIQVSCGNEHSIALTNTGNLYTWGRNQYGQLGLGQGLKSADQPQLVKSLQGLTVRQIATGGHHTFALTVSGALFGWGRNSCGQLGVGDTEDKQFPTQVKSLRNRKLVYIVCGEEHTVALTLEGGVFTFGSGKHGQLGHNSWQSECQPRQVMELMGSMVTQVCCGRRHTLAYVSTSRRLYACGLGAYGQLGLESTTKHSSPMLVKSVSESPASLLHLYSGGDQCFCVMSAAASTVSPSDFRYTRPATQVLTYSEDMLRRLTSSTHASKVPPDISQEVSLVFSSPSSLNGSFLQAGEHYSASSRHHGVNLHEAKDLLSSIEKLPNSQIKHIVLETVCSALLPALPSSPPDVEALRVYLTLPFLRDFEKGRNYRSLLVPFGKSLTRLSSHAGKVIDKWWGKLAAEDFERLIQIYKDSVVYILNLPKPLHDLEDRERQSHLFACMKVLQKLHQVNLNTPTMIVNYEKFYIPAVNDKIDIRQDYVQWIQTSRSQGESFFCDFPFVFDAEAKTSLLHTDAINQMRTAVDEVTRRNFVGLFMPQIDLVNPCLVLCVSRENLVTDTINQLTKKCSKDFKKPLKVKFQNEEGVDAGGITKVIFVGEDAVDEGGVRKEFFMLLLREVLDPKFGMFRYYEESRLEWFNPSTFESPDYFMLIGVLCGLAIYNANIIDLHFPLALYKKLLKRGVGLDDMKELQPSVGRSLESLLEYDGDDFEETFCLTFEITEEIFGQAVSVPLIEDAKDTPVTTQNRQEYVDLYLNYVFNKSVDDAFQAFYSGFHRVCGGRVLELFHPLELQAMVVGNENYDWEQLQKNTQYKPDYHPNHPVIRNFWQVFQQLSHQDKKKFLLFLTGSDRIPIHGMKAVPIVIQPVKGGGQFLPVAHTCFNLLDLPQYPDADTLKDKLLLALAHCKGFGLV